MSQKRGGALAKTPLKFFLDRDPITWALIAAFALVAGTFAAWAAIPLDLDPFGMPTFVTAFLVVAVISFIHSLTVRGAHRSLATTLYLMAAFVLIRPFTLYYAAATASPTTNPVLAFDVLELLITGSIAAIVAWILYRIGRWIAHL